MYFSFSPSPPSTSYATSAMDIPSSSNARTQSPSCAYPSWPRRASLSSNPSLEDSEPQSTSFIISDEELFPSVFDDLEQDCTPPTTPSMSRSPASSAMMAHMVVDNGSLMRELVAQEKAKRKRRKSTSSKKSRSGSGTSSKHMSPILEVVE